MKAYLTLFTFFAATYRASGHEESIDTSPVIEGTGVEGSATDVYMVNQSSESANWEIRLNSGVEDSGTLSAGASSNIASVTQTFYWYAESPNCEWAGNDRCSNNRCFTRVVVTPGDPSLTIKLGQNACSGGGFNSVDDGIDDWFDKSEAIDKNQW